MPSNLSSEPTILRAVYCFQISGLLGAYAYIAVIDRLAS